MALGLTLDELILIYNIQFPVLQQNEDDTWYDQNGRIVGGQDNRAANRRMVKGDRHLRSPRTTADQD